MSVRGLLSILWREIGIILVVAALFAAGGAWANSGQDTVWAATAYVLVPDAPFVTGTTPANRDRQIQTDIASVRELAFTEEMLADAGLDMDPEAARAAVTVTSLEEADIVKVVATGSSEAQAEALAEVAAPLFAESLNDYKSAPYYELAESLRGENRKRISRSSRSPPRARARLPSKNRPDSVYLNMAYESALEALGEAERASNANQVLSYSVSAVPRPSPARGGLLGLVVGLLVGSAVAYWWYAAGDSPQDKSQRPGLDVPVLGLVNLDCRRRGFSPSGSASRFSFERPRCRAGRPAASQRRHGLDIRNPASCWCRWPSPPVPCRHPSCWRTRWHCRPRCRSRAREASYRRGRSRRPRLG